MFHSPNIVYLCKNTEAITCFILSPLNLHNFLNVHDMISINIVLKKMGGGRENINITDTEALSTGTNQLESTHEAWIRMSQSP